MSRSLSASQVLTIKNETIALGGIWADCIGEMDSRGFVFIWGQSGNGKSSAVMSFCRELLRFGKVLYLSQEEGFSLSMQNTLRRFAMAEVGRAFQMKEKCTYEELVEILAKPKSPRIAVIDSVQEMELTYKQFRELGERFPKKLFVLVSQADGKQPLGRPAGRMKYFSGLKLWVEGYTVFSKGRFIGPTGRAVIWEEGARDYWGGVMVQ